MKKLIILILLLLVSPWLSAQDYIFKRNGQELYGNIKEISSTEISYTDTLNTNVLRVINKSEVLMIIFRNGVKEIYTTDNTNNASTPVQQAPQVPQFSSNTLPGPIVDLGSNDYSINGKVYHFRYIKDLLLSTNDPTIYKLLLTARLEGVFGNILAYSSIPIGIIAFALASDGVQYGNTAEIILGITTGAWCLSSNGANIFFKIDKRKKINEAIALYNKKVEAQNVQP
ncbi:MAG TPA: hypothetical protein VNB90_02905 [Cytophagaceae bacterium]|nr:hypothetical protein [Cytophagaceae bacterium]